MIRYPPDFPLPARTCVERALSDAEDEFIAISAAKPRIMGSRMWEVDQAAVFYVLAVFEVIVHVSSDAAREAHWSAGQLRTTSEDLLDQLLEMAYRQKQSKWDGRPTLDDFTTVVHRDLRTFPFWSGFQKTIRELSARLRSTRNLVRAPLTPEPRTHRSRSPKPTERPGARRSIRS